MLMDATDRMPKRIVLVSGRNERIKDSGLLHFILQAVSVPSRELDACEEIYSPSMLHFSFPKESHPANQRNVSQSELSPLFREEYGRRGGRIPQVSSLKGSIHDGSIQANTKPLREVISRDEVRHGTVQITWIDELDFISVELRGVRRNELFSNREEKATTGFFQSIAAIINRTQLTGQGWPASMDNVRIDLRITFIQGVTRSR